MEASPIAKKLVSRFEANLIRILRCLLGRVPLAEALPLMVRQVPRPKCLSRACVELVEDTLAKGCTELLVQGGWRNERFLRGGAPITGRLWQRTVPEQLGLRFSPNSLEWLIWLTADNFADPRTRPKVDVDMLTVGDRLLFFFGFRAVESTLAVPKLLGQPALRNHALIWLAFPNRFAECGNPGESNFNDWFQDECVWILEALQDSLAQNWTRIELHKQHITDPQQIQQLGKTQRMVLDRFLSTAERFERRDLARFLLQAGRQLLRAGVSERWIGSVDLRGLRLADRAQMYESALAFYQSLARLREWEQQARHVGFYDDGYQASQLWKSDWETLRGDQVTQAAGELIRSINPLRTSDSDATSAENEPQPL